MRFADVCLIVILPSIAAGIPLYIAGCAQDNYYEITNRQTGEVTYSTTPPAGIAADAPDVPGARTLVGRNSGRAVNQRYIVREITRREYLQRAAKAPADQTP